MTLAATKVSRGSARLARGLARCCAAGLAVSVIAGCDSARLPQEAFVALSDPHKAHPITVTAETATLELPLPPDGSGLVPNSYFDATRFVRRYRQDGKGPLVIGVPAQARHNRAVADNVRAIRRIIAQAGVSGQNVRYDAAAHRAGPAAITLSYDRIAAIGPRCGNWSENVQRNPERLPYANFGCASQRNLAAMVDNPTDLLYPAQETPRLSARRAAAFKAYIDPPQTVDTNIKTK